MWKLLKNAEIFTPETSQFKDILVVGDLIAALGNNLSLPAGVDGELHDLQGLKLVPGFIDAHVHICGGGGEAGPSSRTPEIQLSQLTTSGITTVVGCLGTDAVTRSMPDLLAKAKALEEEGLTTFIYSGAYQANRTLLPSLREDIALIDKVLGAGEIAISDHRSAQPQLAELEHLAAEARVGGMLGGKAGIIHVHLGEGKRGLEPIIQILEQTEIPITQFMPTHINRTRTLLEQGKDYLKAGGNIDLTAGCDDFPLDLQVPQVLHVLTTEKLLNDHVTVTSDGNGSMPLFNDAGELKGMGIGSVKVLWRDVREAILKYEIPLEIGLRTITSNPAGILQLKQRGSIRLGYQADLVALDEDLQVTHVWAKGNLMVQNKRALKWGTYEKIIRGED